MYLRHRLMLIEWKKIEKTNTKKLINLLAVQSIGHKLVDLVLDVCTLRIEEPTKQ